MEKWNVRLKRFLNTYMAFMAMLFSAVMVTNICLGLTLLLIKLLEVLILCLS